MKYLIITLLTLVLTSNLSAGEVTINLTKRQNDISQYQSMVDTFLDSMEYDFNHPMHWCDVTPTGDISVRSSIVKIDVEATCNGDARNARFQHLINQNQWVVGNDWGGPLYDERVYLQSELRRRFPHIRMTWVSQQLMYRVVIKPEYDMRGSDQTALFFDLRVNDEVISDVSKGHLVKFPMRTFLFQAFTVPNTDEYNGMKGIYSKKTFKKKATITYRVDDKTLNRMTGNIKLSVNDCDRIWVMVPQKGYINKLSIKHPTITVSHLK